MKLSIFTLGAIVCISGCLVAVSPPPVGSIELTDIIPWLGIGTFDIKTAGEAVMDTSNDAAFSLGAHQLISRAGFNYENYWALADDGYITQLIRIINPLADPTYMKPIPVIIQHGQTANSRNFVMQSNGQHFPMRWPRPGTDLVGGGHFHDSHASDIDHVDSNHPEDVNNNGFNFIGDLTGLGKSQAFRQSSNRSLALMLANNGYDVWLASTRGVDDNNRGFMGRRRAIETLTDRWNIFKKNMTLGEVELLWDRTAKSYWSFTLDDQIAHELPSQIGTVMNVTGANKVILTGYSNTCLTTLAMLSIRPDIARHVDTFVAIAPVVYYSKLSGWFRWFMSDFMQLVPKQMDMALFLSPQLAKFLRKVAAKACTNLSVRYTMCKFLFNTLFGSSSQFRTNLELPVFGHMLRPTSWKCLAQHLQIVKSHRLAKFDYGPRLNMKFYESRLPPEYKLHLIDRNIKMGLVSGDKDVWANPHTVEEVRTRLSKKVELDLTIQDYNHVDLAAAFDVDVRVNLPILEFLESSHKMQLVRSPQSGGQLGLEDPEREENSIGGSD